LENTPREKLSLNETPAHDRAFQQPVLARFHRDEVLIAGFSTSFPVNRWLLQRGVKEIMG
jgi:hypothetical protein